jgi:hypothetical protein
VHEICMKSHAEDWQGVAVSGRLDWLQGPVSLPKDPR